MKSSNSNEPESNAESSNSMVYLDIEDSLQHIALNYIDSSLWFDLSSAKGISKFKIRNLGQVECLENVSITNSVSFSGLNSGAIRANNTLSFYKNGKMKGWFYIGGDEYENIYIQNCKLILEYKKNGVDCFEHNSIDLANGIPSEIFLRCKDDLGNFYSLNTQ